MVEHPLGRAAEDAALQSFSRKSTHDDEVRSLGAGVHWKNFMGPARELIHGARRDAVVGGKLVEFLAMHRAYILLEFVDWKLHGLE